jgi:hypothetical protein
MGPLLFWVDLTAPYRVNEDPFPIRERNLSIGHPAGWAAPSAGFCVS